MATSIFAEGSQLRVHYAGSLDFAVGQPFYKSLHHHPDATEILLICEGAGTYQIGDGNHEVQTQSIVVYNQGVWHEERSSDTVPHRMLYVGFSGLAVNGLEPGMFIQSDRSPVISVRDRYHQVEHKFREILREYLHPSAESEFMSSHLLAVLLADLARMIHHKDYGRKNQRNAKVVELVKHYVQENYSQPIELADLAAAAYLSPFHLSRLFKEEAGISPIHYVQHYRMEVAKHLLSVSDETLRGIAHRVGYHSEPHFQNLFKRLHGVAPGEYRKMAKDEGI